MVVDGEVGEMVVAWDKADGMFYRVVVDLYSGSLGISSCSTPSVSSQGWNIPESNITFVFRVQQQEQVMLDISTSPGMRSQYLHIILISLPRFQEVQPELSRGYNRSKNIVL